MLSQRNRAAVPTTAPKNIQLSESYRNSASASRTKLQIGELLLALAPLSKNQQKEYWVQFEAILKRYLDLRICEVAL
jgi:hypothetical protein